MSLFVYVTEECKDRAKTENAETELEQIQDRVTRDQSTSIFPPKTHPYLVRIHGGSLRWIAKKYSVNVDGDAHEVLALLTVLSRDDRDYKHRTEGFAQDPVGYGKRRLEPLMRGVDLADFVRSEIRKKPPKKIEALSSEETRYINESISSLDGEQMIYESEGWVKKMEKGDRLFFQSIMEAIDCALRDDDRVMQSLPVSNTDGYNIAYQWIGEDLYLHDYYQDGEKPKWAIPESIIAERNSDKGRERIYRYFFRSYPAYFMAAELDFWAKVEQDRNGNFSLSPEESDIVFPRKVGESHKSSKYQDSPINSGTVCRFPKFIKGRAGSGKSTVLQYLYSEYFARWARVKKDNNTWNDLPPGYLACNKELVDKARSFVESVLRKNHNYENEFRKNESFDQIKADLDNSFLVFHDYFLSLVPDEDKASYFPNYSDKHVDFARFRRMWEKQFKGNGVQALEDYGPDISWHIIRSFIKGLTADDFLTPDEYAEIPKARQSVSIETFNKVYEKVWPWYQEMTSVAYHSDDGRYWDDQDLVRYVLNKGLLRDGRLGMFCDEAQDFTSIEIEAIFKMSVFAERKIYSQDISKIPMVFAGDEFQTLNPTGFSWAAIQAAFTEKFVLRTDVAGFQIPWHEIRVDLRSNYRSLDYIVRFSNSVQILRGGINGDGLVPQKGWRLGTEERLEVPFFLNNSREFWEAVRINPSIFTIIVPCLANEETSYLDGHCELNGLVIQRNNGQTTMPPTFSAIKAKGLDYQNVIVYGFGEYMVQHDLYYPCITAEGSSDERNISLEYFINRLYVAVSRPRDQLFIVDSERGKERLWNKFFSRDDLVGMIRKSEMDIHVWGGEIACLRDGVGNDVVTTGHFDHVKFAQELEDTAETPSDYWNARDYYLIGNQPENAKKCDAERLVLESKECYGAERNEKLFEAAGLYQEIGRYYDAGDCYWKSCSDNGWAEMARMLEAIPMLRNQDSIDGLKFRIATIISRKDIVCEPDVNNAVAAIARFIQAGNSGALTTLVWRTVLTRLLSKIVKNDFSVISRVIDDILFITNFVIVERAVLKELADICFSNNDLAHAISLYERGKQESSESYKIAKFRTTVYPECVAFRTCEADDELIFKAFLANPEKCPTESSKRRIVARAVVSQETWTKSEELASVVNLLREFPDFGTYEELAELAKELAKTEEEEKIGRMLYRAAAIKRYERMGHGEALNGLMTLVIKDDGSEVNRDLVNCGSAFLIRLLARIVDAPESEKKPDQGIYDRLRGFLKDFLSQWCARSKAHVPSEVPTDELEKVVIRYIDDNIKDERGRSVKEKFYRAWGGRLGGIDVKRKTIEECQCFEWQPLFDSIFNNQNNFLVRHTTVHGPKDDQKDTKTKDKQGSDVSSQGDKQIGSDASSLPPGQSSQTDPQVKRPDSGGISPGEGSAVVDEHPEGCDVEKKTRDASEVPQCRLGIDESSDGEIREAAPSFVEECVFLKNFVKYVEMCGFIYSPRDLVRFHTSVKCETFTLLGGQPGFGKSSLVELYFRMLGCVEWKNGGMGQNTKTNSAGRNYFFRVVVQPSWMEPADLRDAKGVDDNILHEGCGLDRFLEQATQDADHLYCICFEEVNLSRVEHYMADVVQAISRSPDGQCSDATKIGQNVRFVGTCNSDESTQPISRRFLDRCNMIELANDEGKRETLIENAFAGRSTCLKPLDAVLDKTEVLAITTNNYAKWCSHDRPMSFDDIKEMMLKFDKSFASAGIRPSPRVLGDIARYIFLRPAFDGNDRPVLDEAKRKLYALDEGIAQRILSCFQATPKTIQALDGLKGMFKGNNPVNGELMLSYYVADNRHLEYEDMNLGGLG